MPFVIPGLEDAPAGGFVTPDQNLTRTQSQAAALQTKGADMSFGSTLKGVALLAAPDLLDTVSSSLHLTERGEVTNKLLDAIGTPGLQDFYSQHREAVELGSGVAGAIGSDFLAGRVLRASSGAMKFLSKVPYAGRIATLDKDYKQALKAVQAADLFNARRGVIGVEQYVGDVTLPQLGSKGLTASRDALARRAQTMGFFKGLARNVTTEGIMGATLNQNSFLYSSDMSENLMWMTAGLGVGAAVDRLSTTYAMRRFANSDRMARTFARAYDPTGIEADRLKSLLTDVDPESNNSHLGYLQGHHSDLATSYMVNARTLQNDANTTMADLGQRRERLGTQLIQLARDSMQKVMGRGINGIAGTGASLQSAGVGNHIDMRLYEDPTAFYGVESLGAGKITAIHNARTANLNSRLDYVMQTLREGGVWRNQIIKDRGKETTIRRLKPLTEEQRDAYRTEYKQLVFQNSLTPMVSTGREWVPLSVGQQIEDFVEPEIKMERSAERKLWTATETETTHKIGLSNDGELFLPSRRKLDKLSLNEHLRLYRVGQKALDDMVANATPFILPAKPNWFQLDLAENLIKRTGDEGLVTFPGGMTRQEAQVESFKQKVVALQSLKNTNDPEVISRARMMYNLPTLSAYEAGQLGTSEHPIEVILRGANPHKMDDWTYGQLIDGIKSVRHINDMGQPAKDTVESLSGDMFNFLRDNSKTPKPIKPLLAYKRPFSPFDWSQEDLAERLAQRKALVRDNLTGATNAPLTSSLSQNLLTDPDFFTSSQVQGLMDSQVQSFLPGFATAAPQTARGSLLNDFVSREWRDRDNPIMLAAARIRDKGERLVRSVMRERILGHMGDVVNRVNGPRNMRTRLLLNQYLSFRPGWDLAQNPVAIKLGNGEDGFQFALDQKSELNQKRWKQAYGEDMPKDAVLRGQDGKPIILDQLGMEFKTRFNQMTEDIGNEKNALLASQGLGKISMQAHYAPPPNTRGKFIGFTLDASRNPVPGGTIVASTPEEFSRLRSMMENDSNSVLNRDGHTFYTQDELEDFADVWDKAQMNWLDPGVTAGQPGRRGTGRLTGPAINPNAIEDALTWARNSYLRHGDDIMRVLMKDQINAAQARAQIARVTKRNASGAAEKGRSIYDYYVENLTGKMGIASDASVVGRASRVATNWANSVLEEVSPSIHKVTRNLMDYIQQIKPGQKTETEHKAFLKLRDELGEYMPFKNASELGERMIDAKRPPELAQITGRMSSFEAAMRLRLFEVIHPIMNLAGIITSMPAVVRATQRFAGESTEDYARRVGHVATIFNLPDGKELGVIDMAKLAYKGFMRAWDRAEDPNWAYRVSHGYMTQEVAEFQRQFGAIQSKSEWKAFMFGDPKRENRFMQKGLVGWLSILSDRSEDFSRSWGHMVGVELAEHLGIQERQMKESFAHDIANKMIANYDPKNRPAIFQGALGAPIGLFQSFMWNYYQRLFRYAETGDKRSFLTQYAMQSAVFGVKGLPGFDQVNKLFFDHSDGDNSPYDAIYDRLGPDVADVLMGGTLSNLPKLVNMLPGEQDIPAVDLYSRGGVNVRLPVMNGLPMFDTAKRVFAAVGQGAGMFSRSNPHISGNELAEILSNLLTNRPMAGFMEQAFANGYDTDWQGATVSTTKGAMESIYRIMGARSMRQSKEQEAYYTNRNAQELQNAKMDDLKRSARAAIRDGDVDSLPGYFNQYVQNGGNPAMFKRWIKYNFKVAETSKAEQQLQAMLKDPTKMAETQRLLDAGVSVDKSDANTDAYTIPTEPDPSTNPNMPVEWLNGANAEENMNALQTDPTLVTRF